MLYGARAVMPAELPRLGHLFQRLLVPCRPVARVLPRSVLAPVPMGLNDVPPSVAHVPFFTFSP